MLVRTSFGGIKKGYIHHAHKERGNEFDGMCFFVIKDGADVKIIILQGESHDAWNPVFASLKFNTTTKELIPMVNTIGFKAEICECVN